MLRRALLWMGALLVCTSASHTAHAQACFDDDAGDDDGGMECAEPDSGGIPVDDQDASFPDGGGPDAGNADGGGMDASIDIGHACSCESAEGNDQGLIHVCTGSESESGCRRFTCESGTVRNRPCPTNEVKLCCTIGARDLYSQLYEDCTHPNCDTGFRAQCLEFGGSISEGACDIEQHDAYEDNDGGDSGLCSVSRVGGAHADKAVWLLIASGGLGLGLRRRARARTR